MQGVAVRKNLALLWAILLLSACTTIPAPQSSSESADWLTQDKPFTEPLAELRTRQAWRYTAKVGIQTPKAREQANVVWQFADQANNVRLFGPLGAGAVRLQFDQYGVMLSDNKGTLHEGNSAEALLSRIAGWPIPLEALSYWLFALPDPDTSYRYQQNEFGQLSVLEQQGWSIVYSKYKDAGLSRLLPRKVVATKRVAPSEDIKVTLISKGWEW